MAAIVQAQCAMRIAPAASTKASGRASLKAGFAGKPVQAASVSLSSRRAERLVVRAEEAKAPYSTSLSYGKYAEQLQRYAAYFDPSQLLVLHFTSLLSSGGLVTTLRTIAAFLGIADVWSGGAADGTRRQSRERARDDRAVARARGPRSRRR